MLERLQGNAQLKHDLSAALAAGHLANSILLVGEAGCGSGFAARCLAADYLYPAGGAAAQTVLDGHSPECLEVRGEGASGQIRVEAIREVRKQIAATALSAKGRVVILYGAEKMNPASANALLKSLEEPPEGVLFILTTASQTQLLPTILSRCGVYTLAPVSQRECAAALCRQKPEISREKAAELALIYGGRIGTCIDAMEGSRAASLALARQLAQAIAQRDEYTAQALVSPLEKDKPALLLLWEDCANLALATLHQPGLTPMKSAQCIALAQIAGDARTALQGNGNTRLVLTASVARLF